MLNPLLDPHALPDPDAILDHHLGPALDTCIAALDHAVARARDAGEPATWASVARPVSAALDALDTVTERIEHLLSIRDSAELRTAYGQSIGALAAARARFRQDEALLARYRALAASPSFDALSPARKRVVRQLIDEALAAGCGLAPQARIRLNAVRERLAVLSKRFLDNLGDATRAYACHITDPAELDGLPEATRQAARAAASRAGSEGHRLTLDYAIYDDVMRFATRRTLRERMYRARTTRASLPGVEHANGQASWDNGPVIGEILALRQEDARLRGHRDFATASLGRMMAGTPQHARAFLDDLHQRSLARAREEWQALCESASEAFGLAEPAPADLAFLAERLRAREHGVSSDEVRRYFPEPVVLRGLFALISRLFGIALREEAGVSTQHGIRLMRVEDVDGRLLAHCRLDLHARPGKRDGAWSASGRARGRHDDGSPRTPVAHLICNLAATDDAPPCFTFEQVVTLFHEMGHCLHHMLTSVDESAVAGTRGVEWDAIEFPSQWLEYFCQDREVVASLSAHVDTGEPLPDALLDRLCAARRIDRHIELVHQIALSMQDLALHSADDEAAGAAWQARAAALHQRYEVVPLDPLAHTLHTFSHVFAGPYAAAYYSYLWARVLAADAHAAFEEARAAGGEAGLREAGRRFRREILEPGGSRQALASFVAFRGRAPDPEALLREQYDTA
ncbi:M3 family metallopeptidase [Burkholderia sp. Cy-637]|uniref:M3 family metallopeptidase n=2 Tax=unclassified Burkholderia TaxID=2613784 RepID=UPI00142270F5|nr:M3 family metallopeptidase [Burkholderia sp. Cy-637]NIF91884.1 M3 family metallopeptidase [Burkholderia sp. Cy-637]